MQINQRTRWLMRFQALLFAVAFLALLGLLAWASLRYEISTQVSTLRSADLSEHSVRLLQRLDGPVEMLGFVQPDDMLAEHMASLAARYQRHKPDLRYRQVNPDARPDLVRDFQIEGSGELIVEYQGRQERIRVPSEPRISAALQRLHRTEERPVVYLRGHGERSLEGAANHDLGGFGDYLKQQGFRLTALAPGDTMPEQPALLVLAGPRSDWLPQTQDMVREHVEQGGHLLWLVDAQDETRLAFLAEMLDLAFVPGVVVEPRAEELLGVDNPRLLVLGDYPAHPVLDGLDGVSLFLSARGLEPMMQQDWEVSPLLLTGDRHWSETSDLDAPVLDEEAGDRPGPLAIGLGLSRGDGTGEGSEQRVAVIGDADFLSNAYLGNGVNLQLGLNLVEWLALGDPSAAMHGSAARDQRLQYSDRGLLILGGGALLVAPALCLLVALTLWWRRRRG